VRAELQVAADSGVAGGDCTIADRYFSVCPRTLRLFALQLPDGNDMRLRRCVGSGKHVVVYVDERLCSCRTALAASSANLLEDAFASASFARCNLLPMQLVSSLHASQRIVSDSL